MDKTDSCCCALCNFIIGQKRNAFIINRSRIKAKCRLLIILCKQASLEITIVLLNTAIFITCTLHVIGQIPLAELFPLQWPEVFSLGLQKCNLEHVIGTLESTVIILQVRQFLFYPMFFLCTKQTYCYITKASRPASLDFAATQLLWNLWAPLIYESTSFMH